MEEIKKQFPVLVNSYIATTGIGFAMILPIIVGGIVDQMGFGREMVGWLAAANISGIGIGGLAAAFFIGRTSLTRIIQFGLVGMILFDLASIPVREESALLLLRFCSGLAGGLVYGTAMAVFSGLKNSIRGFGLYVITFCVTGAIITTALPFLIEAAGIEAGFAILALMELIALAGTGAVRQLKPRATSREIASLQYLLSRKPVILALLGYFLMQMAGGTVYAYLERIGKEAGLSADFIGITVGLSYLLGLSGGAIVVMLGNKRGLWFPIAIGMAGLLLGMSMLWWSEIPLVFFVGNCFFGLSWSVAIPYFQQLQSQQDPQGKVVSFGTLLNMGGRATGPAIAAATLGNSPFQSVIWISITAVILCLAAVWPVLRA